MSEHPTIQKSTFINLPPEILVIIFQLVETKDLISLMRTHPNFQKICRDASFWEQVIDPPDRYQILDEIFTNYVTDKTHTLRLTSTSGHGKNRGVTSSLPPSLLINLYSVMPNLTELYLIAQKFDGSLFPCTLLPKGLKVFHLTRSVVNVDKYACIPNEEQPYDIEASISYFRGIEKTLPNLDDLDLASCPWIAPLDLIHIRKLSKLLRLNLNGCRFQDDSNPIYADSATIRRLQWRRIFSAIANSGFDSLKILNLNNTDLPRGQFIQAFFRNRRSSVLEALHMGYYDSDLAWPLMNYRLESTPLMHAINLKILDVSGFAINNNFSGDVKPCRAIEKIIMQFVMASKTVLETLRARGIDLHYSSHGAICTGRLLSLQGVITPTFILSTTVHKL